MGARTDQQVGNGGVRMIPPAGRHEPMGDRLKHLFDRTTDPMPAKLQQLADALEKAFERGELVMSKRLS